MTAVAKGCINNNVTPPERGVNFFCPGCNEIHGIIYEPTGWTFNGDFEKPTFSPSVLVTSGHFVKGYEHQCWCNYNAKQIEQGKEPSSFKCFCCHSFVKDGMIQFLDDCSHDLAGQTVPLPPWPYAGESE